LYCFVRTDLSLPQQIVQASHAVLEATKAFLSENLEHPHLVILSAKDQSALFKVAKKLDITGIRYRIFIEPDINDEATSLCTEVISGDARRIFKNYQCIKEST
jgi:hypothetical protein